MQSLILAKLTLFFLGKTGRTRPEPDRTSSLVRQATAVEARIGMSGRTTSGTSGPFMARSPRIKVSERQTAPISYRVSYALLFQLFGALFFFWMSCYILEDKNRADRQIATNADLLEPVAQRDIVNIFADGPIYREPVTERGQNREPTT